jgi:hypothetical protein
MLEQLRQQLLELHLELPKNNLVAWTSGNVSARDPGTGLVVIKPSGVRYERLRPEHMGVVDLDGRIVEGDLKPSSDTASHLYIYRHRAEVNGVVHTHSRYATAFAAVGRSIPVYLTAQADEFGGEIRARLCPSAMRPSGAGRRDDRPVPCRPAQEPRRVHGRPVGRRRGQGRDHDRGRPRPCGLPPDRQPDVLADDVVEASHQRYTTDYGQ